MIKKPITGLIQLGSSLRYLQDQQEGHPIILEKESERGMTFIKGSIERFLKSLNDFGLIVTVRAAGELEEFYNSIKDKPVGSRLDKDEAIKLKGITRTLQKTLHAEAKGIHSFFVTDKHIPLEKLIDNQGDLFPKGIFEGLSDIAKYDVREAGRCLAFERSTACAFHILRATEDVLKEFYCRIVKQKRVKKFMWGNMTADLAKRRKRPSDITIKNLDYIRENFRNPTAHPEARYDIDEARSLFNLCVDVITRRIKDPLWRNK